MALLSHPGDLHKGIVEYKSATNLAWIVGRIYCTGTAEDYEKVHSFQDKLSLVPLSAYGPSVYVAPQKTCIACQPWFGRKSAKSARLSCRWKTRWPRKNENCTVSASLLPGSLEWA